MKNTSTLINTETLNDLLEIPKTASSHTTENTVAMARQDSEVNMASPAPVQKVALGASTLQNFDNDAYPYLIHESSEGNIIETVEAFKQDKSYASMVLGLMSASLEGEVDDKGTTLQDLLM